ncbi:MAG: BolA family transcriptional regulator [Deltaproteobacteria bacterium]|nr:BolA family transcriptional regulator [Deltaproteobacteria bacterium]MBI3293894.1 BolA family transcriptional regulator [Deltaproteobacteria bacterium]
MTPFDSKKLKEIVEAGLPESEVTVEDMTGTNDHFQMTIVAQAFAGKSSVERHRMIYAIVGKAIGGPIHALSLKTLTPDEATQQR